jgi:hypothetical protein
MKLSTQKLLIKLSSTLMYQGTLHHASKIFDPHNFFGFRMLILTDFIQSPIIFFGDVTLEIQDRLQIFQGRCPRFSVVPPNEKMCSSPPKVGLLFYLCTKSELSTFSIYNIQLTNGYGLHTFMQSLMSECIALF